MVPVPRTTNVAQVASGAMVSVGKDFVVVTSVVIQDMYAHLEMYVLEI